MKSSQKTRAKKLRVFLLPALVLCLVAAFVFGTLFAIGIWSTTSDGANSKPLGIHVLSSQEKQEINAALNSNGNPYPCINDIQDTCLKALGIGYYPLNYVPDNFFMGYKPDSSATIRQVYGNVTSFTDHLIQLKTSSGRMYEVRMNPYAYQEYVKSYHTYKPTTPGTTVLITFVAQPNDPSTEVDFGQIRSIWISNVDDSIFRD